MPRFHFRPVAHIPLLLLTAALFLTWAADPILEATFPEDRIEAKIREKLPVTEAVGDARINIEDISLSLPGRGALEARITADVQAGGQEAVVIISTRSSPALEGGQLYIRDLLLQDISFEGADLAPGSLKYTLMQAMAVGMMETARQDLETSPAVDLSQEGLPARLASNVLAELRLDRGSVTVGLAPGRVFGASTFAIILALVTLLVVIGFIPRSNRSGRLAPAHLDGS